MRLGGELWLAGDEEGEGLAKCGLVDENAAWVKGIVGEVWSSGRKRCVGQRNCRCSVVWWTKSLRGSRRPVAKCGLADENAAWVKGIVGEVWSDGRNCCVGQEGQWRSVVWWTKTLPGSRRPVVKCGLVDEIAA